MIVEVPDEGVLAALHGERERRGVKDGAGVAARQGADGEVMLGFGERVVGDEAGFGSAQGGLGCVVVGGWRRV